MTIGELQVLLKIKQDGSIDKAKSAMSGAGKSAGGLQGMIAKVTGGFKAALGPIVAITAALGALTAAAGKAIRAADVQVMAVNKLNIALANQGNLLPGTSQRLQEFASQLQNTTRFGDEAILGVQSLLATFGAGEQQIKDMTQATLDMATAQGVDLKAAALLVGKAFAGETSSLSRYGIMVDKNLPKTEKFSAVMEQLQQRFGGTAQAATQTLGGAFQQLSNAFGDIWESVGILIQSFFDLGGGGTGGIQWVAQKVVDLANWMRQDLVIAMSEAKATIIEWVATAAESFVSLQQKIAGLASVLDQDLGDALFNDAQALTNWAEQQRLAAEQIRTNADLMATMGTTMQSNNLIQSEATAKASDHVEVLKSWNAMQKQWVEDERAMSLATQEHLVQQMAFQDALLTSVQTMNDEGYSVWLSSVKGVGDGTVSQIDRMKAGMQQLGFVTRAEAKRSAAEQIANLEAVRDTATLTTEERARLEQMLADLRIQLDTGVAETQKLTLQDSLTAAAQILGQFGGKFKAAAIAAAIINTAQAVTKTWATLGFPAAIPGAAVAVAAGAAQIAKIKSTRSGFKTGTPGMDFQDFGRVADVQLHGSEAVIPKGGGHELAKEIAAALPQGGGGGTVRTTIMIDGKQFMEAITPAFEDATKRRKTRVHPAATGKNF